MKGHIPLKVVLHQSNFQLKIARIKIIFCQEVIATQILLWENDNPFLIWEFLDNLGGVTVVAML